MWMDFSVRLLQSSACYVGECRGESGRMCGEQAPYDGAETAGCVSTSLVYHVATTLTYSSILALAMNVSTIRFLPKSRQYESEIPSWTELHMTQCWTVILRTGECLGSRHVCDAMDCLDGGKKSGQNYGCAPG